MEEKELSKSFVEVVSNLKPYNLNSFKNYVKNRKGLTDLETSYLFDLYKEELKQGKEKENCIYRTALILAYDKAIHYVLSKKNLTDEDFHSIGTIGLMQAIDSFDSSKEVNFLTFAITCIKNRIYRYFQLKKSIDVSESLDFTDSKDGDERNVYEFVSSDENVQRDIETKDSLQYVIKQLAHLTPLEQYCFIASFGIYGKRLTNEQIRIKLHYGGYDTIPTVVNNATVKMRLLLKEGNLTPEELDRKELLLVRNFPILSKEDYLNFSHDKGSRYNFPNIKEKIKAPLSEIKRYLSCLTDMEQYSFIAYFGMYSNPMTSVEISTVLGMPEKNRTCLNNAIKKMTVLTSKTELSNAEERLREKYLNLNYPVLTKDQFLNFNEYKRKKSERYKIMDETVATKSENKGFISSLASLMEQKDEIGEISSKDIENYFEYFSPIEQYVMLARLGYYKSPANLHKIAENLGLSYLETWKTLKLSCLKLKLFISDKLNAEDLQTKKILMERRYRFLNKDGFLGFEPNSVVREVVYPDQLGLNMDNQEPEKKRSSRKDSSYNRIKTLLGYVSVDDIQKALTHLTHNEQYLFIVTSGLYEHEKTITELSTKLHISEVHISYILRTAIKKVELLTSKAPLSEQKKIEREELLTNSYNLISREEYTNFVFEKYKDRGRKSKNDSILDKSMLTEQVLQRLSLKEQFCVMASAGYYGNPLNYTEIAQRLNLSNTTVNQTINSAIKKLILLTTHGPLSEENEEKKNQLLEKSAFPILSQQQFEKYKYVYDPFNRRSEAQQDNLNEVLHLTKEQLLEYFKHFDGLEQYCLLANYGVNEKPLNDRQISEKTDASRTGVNLTRRNAYEKFKMLLKEDNLTTEEQHLKNEILKQSYPIMSHQEYLDFKYTKKIPVHTAKNTEECKRFVGEIGINNILRVISHLKPSEQYCILASSGLYEPIKSRQEIAGYMKISRPQVVTILIEARRKIKLMLEANDLLTEDQLKEKEYLLSKNYGEMSEDAYNSYVHIKSQKKIKDINEINEERRRREEEVGRQQRLEKELLEKNRQEELLIKQKEKEQKEREKNNAKKKSIISSMADRALLGYLTKEQQFFLMCSVGLYGNPMTQKQISERLGVSLPLVTIRYGEALKAYKLLKAEGELSEEDQAKREEMLKNDPALLTEQEFTEYKYEARPKGRGKNSGSEQSREGNRTFKPFDKDKIKESILSQFSVTRIQKALAHLLPNEQYCILAHWGIFEESKTVEEIAEKFDVGENYVNTLLQRGIRKLNLLITLDDLSLEELQEKGKLLRNSYYSIDEKAYFRYKLKKHSRPDPIRTIPTRMLPPKKIDDECITN